MSISTLKSPSRFAATTRRGTRALVMALVFIALGATCACALDPCLTCHGRAGLAVEGRVLNVHPERFTESVHGRLACTDCHKRIRNFPHLDDAELRCDLPCHVDGPTHEIVALDVMGSIHAEVNAPACIICHTGGGAIHGGDIEKLCRSCHIGLDPELSIYPATSGAIVKRAHASVGPAFTAPICTDCHNPHSAGKGIEARSSCAAPPCHPGRDESFGELFDHSTSDKKEPWGGLGAAAAVAALCLGVILFLHSLRS